jgi:hypothetical protein
MPCFREATHGLYFRGEIMQKHILSSAALIVTILCSTASLASAALKFDSDIAPALKTQMLADLAFMDAIQGNAGTPLHQKIFGAVDGKVYQQWFTSRVFSVGAQDCGNPSAVACVDPMYANKMWVTPNYTQFDHPQIARLSVIYHESRHTEAQNNNWPHATCPTPFLDTSGQDMRSIWTGALLQGEPACDITPFGSYGSQTILLENIAMNCSNCTSKVQADAKLFGDDQLNRITDPGSKTQMQSDFATKVVAKR